ncbi:type II toxin-antitoxin system RelE/ParE family toxin [Epilithonimonas vandammei]|uniref:Type II toxin-antitoxin system RelE/ParE family toxin n=1 Tax=Epilithonimonas vandammei TaxID=2487072 RepID=A0A3G8Y3B3_9FLAO|nr:type II toxin-antitoxin system RelE/ParE family toxin [Epilithonimonas vandammei]AZI39892.1 type II toxin-antitoxin system RelE/ParE family toxin [Epilithonimonas vandammei]
MAEKIVWTLKAKKELVEILQYWIDRNKSNAFSLKLNSLIEAQLYLILEQPKIGRKTDIPNVYIKIIHKYLLYYEFVNGILYILTIRHGSQNSENVELK